LLALLAVALALYLVNAHESPQQLLADLRETWGNLRESSGGGR
jgi:hypothetical protein